MGNQYLNFQDISRQINFVDVLNWLNLPYTKKKGEFKGEADNFKFIINIEKNMFFSPDDETVKGSVINFLSEYQNIGLREAASELNNTFLLKPKPAKKEIPELELNYTPIFDDFDISEEIAREYEAGEVKQKSIMSGRIAFKVYDEHGKVTGYVGWHPSRNHWLFPKNFVRPVYNAHNIVGSEIVVTTDLFDCLRLLTIGISATTCLIAKSMTEYQEQVLRKYKRILLLHPEPGNIIQRLAKTSFIKAPVIDQPLEEYTDEEILIFVG